jgi:ubiquinone/menaquinone biosynthesis C-methylase UbiE
MSRAATGEDRIGGIRQYANKVKGMLREFKAVFREPDNRAAYSGAATIREFMADNALQAPEQAVLNKLGPWLTDRRMLDIGVGAGRTALHFAPLVGSYVGIDYAQPTIEACTARNDIRGDNVDLALGDVRDLSRYKSGEFDLVLFSYNGLDSVSHDDRLAALAEMRRVTNPSGFLCFSSHNLLAVDIVFRLRPDQRVNPYSLALGVVRLVLPRLVNRSPRKLGLEPYAMVREGGLGLRMLTYYIRPSQQIAQLRSFGLQPIGVYGLDGRNIAIEAADGARDVWLYYLASRVAEDEAGSAANGQVTAAHLTSS